MRKKASEMTYEEMREYLKNAPLKEWKDNDSYRFKIEGDVDSFMKSRGSISWKEAQAKLSSKFDGLDE